MTMFPESPKIPQIPNRLAEGLTEFVEEAISKTNDNIDARIRLIPNKLTTQPKNLQVDELIALRNKNIEIKLSLWNIKYSNENKSSNITQIIALYDEFFSNIKTFNETLKDNEKPLTNLTPLRVQYFNVECNEAVSALNSRLTRISNTFKEINPKDDIATRIGKDKLTKISAAMLLKISSLQEKINPLLKSPESVSDTTPISADTLLTYASVRSELNDIEQISRDINYSMALFNITKERFNQLSKQVELCGLPEKNKKFLKKNLELISSEINDLNELEKKLIGNAGAITKYHVEKFDALIKDLGKLVNELENIFQFQFSDLIPASFNLIEHVKILEHSEILEHTPNLLSKTEIANLNAQRDLLRRRRKEIENELPTTSELPRNELAADLQQIRASYLKLTKEAERAVTDLLEKTEKQEALTSTFESIKQTSNELSKKIYTDNKMIQGCKSILMADLKPILTKINNLEKALYEIDKKILTKEQLDKFIAELENLQTVLAEQNEKYEDFCRLSKKIPLSLGRLFTESSPFAKECEMLDEYIAPDFPFLPDKDKKFLRSQKDKLIARADEIKRKIRRAKTTANLDQIRTSYIELVRDAERVVASIREVEEPALEVEEPVFKEESYFAEICDQLECCIRDSNELLTQEERKILIAQKNELEKRAKDIKRRMDQAETYELDDIRKSFTELTKEAEKAIEGRKELLEKIEERLVKNIAAASIAFESIFNNCEALFETLKNNNKLPEVYKNFLMKNLEPISSEIIHIDRLRRSLDKSKKIPSKAQVDELTTRVNKLKVNLAEQYENYIYFIRLSRKTSFYDEADLTAYIEAMKAMHPNLLDTIYYKRMKNGRNALDNLQAIETLYNQKKDLIPKNRQAEKARLEEEFNAAKFSIESLEKYIIDIAILIEEQDHPNLKIFFK